MPRFGASLSPAERGAGWPEVGWMW